MVTKRLQVQADREAKVHPSRRRNIQSKPDRTHKKSRPATSIVSNPSSINPLKKRIRDVTRLLERSENLPANVRVDNERALAVYRGELAAAQEEKQKQKMIKKYHMVRFFERQKATRRLKKLRKRLAAASDQDEQQSLASQAHDAEVDLNYTLYCPLNQRYISLYPPNEKASVDSRADDDDAGGKNKPPLWKDVERSMENGTLDSLRNGVSSMSSSKPSLIGSSGAQLSLQVQKGRQGTSKKKCSNQNKQANEEMGRPTEDGDSEDGFFDEPAT